MQFDKIPFEERLSVTARSNRFPLSKDKIFFVENGSIDLFAIEKKEDKPSGTHYFLKEITQGNVIFGFPIDPRFEIMAVAEPKTVLKRIGIEAFFNTLLKNDTLLHEFIPLFNQWVGNLSHLFVRYSPKEDVRLFSIAQKGPLQLQKGEKIMFEHLIGEEGDRTINWVKVEKGELALLGWSNVKVKAPFYLPLRSDLWWEALENCSLISLSPVKMIKEGKWKEALSQLHRWFMDALFAATQEEGLREKKIIEARSTLEETVLKESFGTLASVLHGEKVKESEKKDPLFVACQIIGDKLGIDFKEPKKTKSSNLAKQVADIVEYSGIRYRQVLLDGLWWKEDGGHLLAFYGEESEPVALIRGDKQKYLLIHPQTNRTEIVDERVASQISQVAYYFYPPFKGLSLSGTEMLKFGYEKLKGKIVYAFLIGMAISILDLALPFGSKIIFGVAIPQLNDTLLWQIGLGIMLAAIASALYQFAQGLLIFYINSLSGNRIECAQWDHLLKLPVSFFKKFSVGDLWSRIFGFVSIRRTFNNYYITLLFAGIFSIFYLVAMGFFSLHLTLIALVIAILFLSFSLFCMHLMAKYQRTSLELKGKINGFVVQVVQGISKIKNAGAEKRIFSHWAKLYAEQKKNDLKSQNINTAISAAFATLPSFSFLCIFSLMIYFVASTLNNPENIKVSKGNFFGFITAFAAFSSAIMGAVPPIMNFYRRIRPLWNRAKAIFEEQIEDDPTKKYTKRLEGNVVIDHISFRYEPKAPLVLNNIYINAHAGEFVGIVGPSGSGKSTLIRLLLGFEKPEKGSIYYDGEDLSHLDLRSLRRQIGVVLQHGSLLAGTIYENLVYGGLYTKEQIERAIKLSGFDQDLWNFPMGLHTVISSGGGTLSGGQRQRLMIARALISNPKILLFDEATSALDNRTQELIKENIEKLQVTRIVIAHRLSTIRQADRIYLIEKGEVVDQGTFNELSSRGGKFAEFVERQKL